MDPAGEVVADRRDKGGQIPGEGLPVAPGPLLRVAGEIQVGAEMADQRMVGGVDGGLVIAPAQPPLHVRLPGADPHLADDDVGQHHRVVAAHLEAAPLGRGLHRPEIHRPAAIARLGRHGLPAELHGDLLAIGGPAPDRDRPALLEDRMVGEERVEGHVGPDEAEAQGQAGERRSGATEQGCGMHRRS